jgi:hypothetical protein
MRSSLAAALLGLACPMITPNAAEGKLRSFVILCPDLQKRGRLQRPCASSAISARIAEDNFVAHIEGCAGKHYRADCPIYLAVAIRARHGHCNICCKDCPVAG